MVRVIVALVVGMCGCKLTSEAVSLDASTAQSDASVADAAAPDAGSDAARLTACPLDTLICDGFESGDLAAWSQQISGGDLEIVSTPTYLGGGALKATTPVAGAEAYVTAVIPAITTGSIYTRAYFYLPSSLISPGLVELTNTGDSSGIHSHYAVDTNEALLLVNEQSAADAQPLPRDTWVCVEMRIDVDASGGGELFVDGRSAASISGTDTALPGGYANLEVGVVYTEATGPFEIYIDEIVMDTAPIGCD